MKESKLLGSSQVLKILTLFLTCLIIENGRKEAKEEWQILL